MEPTAAISCVKGSFAHHPVTALLPSRSCKRCGGATLRLSMCGLCRAIETGMTDEQIDFALEVLMDHRRQASIRRRVAQGHG